MISAVIFDMDGTLLDTEKLNLKFWCEAGAHYGFNLEASDILYIRSLDAKISQRFLEDKYPGFDFYGVREERRRLMRNHVDTYGLELKPGVVDILAYLASTNLKIAVATATSPAHAKSYLEMLGIYHYFDEIVYTAMVQIGKPEPDVYQYACQCIGICPEECFAVEDSPNGVKSAAAAGCNVIFIPDLTPADDEIRSLITYEFSSLHDLKKQIMQCISDEGK